MGTRYTPPALKPFRAVGAVAIVPVQANRRLGHQGITFCRAVAAIPFVLRHYRKEVLRLTADVGWGNGSLIVGGGTVGVVIILCGFGGTSAGTYDHYFFQFLNGIDVLFSVVKVVVFVLISTFIQCYYGYIATGGPEGVGHAAGRAIKMVIVVMVFVNLFLTLAIWGIDPGFRISG